jgi:trigger factor
MQISLENLSNLERKLEVKVPVEVIENEIKSKLNEIAKTAKIAGFRPGKVPFTVIKNNYGKAAHASAIEKLLKQTYIEALEKEKLNPVGHPEIKIISSNPNESLVYTATFEVFPEIKLVDLAHAKVEKPISEITASDIDEALEKMRKAQVTWQEIKNSSRKTQKGDQITIDFTTKVHKDEGSGEPKTEKDVKFILGDGSMWQEFEKPLYDLSFGDEKNFVLQVPDTHINKDIAGKKVEFMVKLHKIHEPLFPALDDAFAAKMDIKEGGVSQLKETTRKHLENELQLRLKNSFKQAILDKLLDVHSIDVPKSLVAAELQKHAIDWQKRFAQTYGKAQKAPVFPSAEYEPQVKRNIALGLLMAQIVKEHNLRVTQEEVLHKLKELVADYYKNEELMDKVLQNQHYQKEIEAMLLEDKVIDHLTGQIKPVEKKHTYKELISKK